MSHVPSKVDAMQRGRCSYIVGELQPTTAFQSQDAPCRRTERAAMPCAMCHVPQIKLVPWRVQRPVFGGHEVVRYEELFIPDGCEHHGTVVPGEPRGWR